MAESNELLELVPEEIPVPKESRSRKDAAKRAVRSEPLEAPVVISLAALERGDETALELLSAALEAAGFLDHLPDGDTVVKAYSRLQRYLGYGRRPSGKPELGTLTWLALRTQMFTATT